MLTQISSVSSHQGSFFISNVNNLPLRVYLLNCIQWMQSTSNMHQLSWWQKTRHLDSMDANNFKHAPAFMVAKDKASG